MTRPLLTLARTIVVDIDSQKGFGEAAASDRLQGLAKSERAEVAAGARIAAAVHGGGGTVFFSRDTHNRPGTLLCDGRVDNRAAEHFGIFGEHCLPGTADHELDPEKAAALAKMERAEGRAATVIPVDGYDPAGRVGAERVFLVNKNHTDVTKREDLGPDGRGIEKANRSFLNTLGAAIARAQEHARSRGKIDDTAIIIDSKIAEVCVRGGALSIRAAFPNVRMFAVEDAICSLPPEVARAAGLKTKAEVMAEFAAAGIGIISTNDVLPGSRFIADGIRGR